MLFRSEVCDEWLNFQTFAKWHDENYYEVNERLHLDKDILIPGNTLYAPDRCLLIPQRINELFTCKVNGNGLPVGIYKTSAGRYNSSYNGKNIGTFDGYYITNGKAMKIKCTKSARDAQTIYKDLQGNVINVNDGNTFINICPTDAKVVIE